MLPEVRRDQKEENDTPLSFPKKEKTNQQSTRPRPAPFHPPSEQPYLLLPLFRRPSMEENRYSRMCSALSTDATELAASLDTVAARCRQSARSNIEALAASLRMVASAATELVEYLEEMQTAPLEVPSTEGFIPQIKNQCQSSMNEIQDRLDKSQTGWKVALAGGTRRLWSVEQVASAKDALNKQSIQLQRYLDAFRR